MKQLLFVTLMGIFGSATLSAQTLTFSDATNLVQASLDTLGAAGEIQVEWGVVNTTSSAVSVKARRNIIQEVPGSTNYFCWGVCYDETVNISSVSQTIQALDTNFTFYAHYLPHGNAGLTAIEYVFYLSTNSSDMTTNLVRYCVDSDCTLGVENNSTTPMLSMASANPLSGIGSIQYNLNAPSGKMEVFNLMGQSVGQYKLTNNRGFIVLDGADFASGQYVVAVTNSNGQRSTLPLMIQ